MAPSWHQAGCCCVGHCNDLTVDQWNAFVATEADNTSPPLAAAYQISDYEDGDIVPKDRCLDQLNYSKAAEGTPTWQGIFYSAEYIAGSYTGRQWGQRCHWKDIRYAYEGITRAGYIYQIAVDHDADHLGYKLLEARVYWYITTWRMTIRLRAGIHFPGHATGGWNPWIYTATKTGGAGPAGTYTAVNSQCNDATPSSIELVEYSG